MGTRERSPGEIRGLLEGPVVSVPGLFHEDGTLDVDGVRAVVERGIAEARSTGVLLTYGDAHLEMLDDAEIREFVRAVASQTAGRAAVVAATGLWSTRRAVEFARFCRDLGVDAVQVTYALRWGSYDGNDVVAHHRAIAQVLPVQMFGHSTGDVHAALVDDERVFGYKAEDEGSAFDLIARYGDRYQVMMGGAHWAHLTTWPLGVRSWMSLWTGLRPDLARAYRDAFVTGDLAAAADLVRRTDIELFRISRGYGGGLQAVWRAALELDGIARRYRPAPLLSLGDDEMERLRLDLDAVGLLASSGAGSARPA